MLTDFSSNQSAQPAEDVEILEEVVLVESSVDNISGDESRHVASDVDAAVNDESDLVNDEDGETQIEEANNAPRIIKCNVCNKILSSVKSLKRHVSTYHFKTLKCDVCGKFFSTEAQLSIHIKMHQGYKCDECGKVYSTSASLRGHRFRNHPSDVNAAVQSPEQPATPVLCDFCSKTFKSIESLRIHKGKVHKGSKDNLGSGSADNSGS